MNLTDNEKMTRMERIMADIRDQVFKPLSGIKSNYETIVRDHHKIMLNPQFSTDYKLEQKAEAIEQIRVLKRDATEKALETIDTLEEKHRPKSEIDKMSETVKLTNVTIWVNTLPEIERKEFVELYRKYQHDPDFVALAKAAMKKRHQEGWIREAELADPGDPSGKVFKDTRKLVKALAGLGDHILLMNEEGQIIYQKNFINDLNAATALRFEAYDKTKAVNDTWEG